MDPIEVSPPLREGPAPTKPAPTFSVPLEPVLPDDLAPALERRGRAWLIWSFLLCPCHLPLSLAVLTTVLAGTSFGVIMRDHAWVAGTAITAFWILGTGYGLRLIRQAEKAGGACPARTPRS